MFQNILLLYIILAYVPGLYTSQCEEYIVIIPESAACFPIQTNNIDWPNRNCPHNSTDILTYNEFTTNKTCVLDLYYMFAEATCKPKKNVLPNTYHTFITTEATITTEDQFTETINETKENNNNSKVLECKTDLNSVGCRNKMQTTEQIDTKTIDEMRLIFHNQAAINFDLEHFDYNKWIASKILIHCDYTQNICLDDSNITINGDFNSKINTIFVSTINVNISKPSQNHNIITKNISSLNCVSNNVSLIQQNYMYVAVYNILKMYHCNTTTSDVQVNNLNDTENRKVNAYFSSNLLSNTKINDIECTQEFKFINKQSVNVECKALILSENDDNVINKQSNDRINSLNNNNFFIWHCNYTNFNSAIICDQLQSQKYNALEFLNCTEDRSNKMELLSDNNNIINSTYVINLTKKQIPLNTNKTHNKNRKIGLLNKNLQLHFISNKSNFGASFPSFHISKGSVFNLWANDDEEKINRHYNSSLVELNLLNCTICNSTSVKNSNDSVKVLKPCIILSKQNTTSLSFFIENILNENKDHDMNIAVINCIPPNLTELSNTSTTSIKPNLRLECEIVDLEKYSSNITANISVNYSTSTESYDTNSTLLMPSTTAKNKEEKSILGTTKNLERKRKEDVTLKPTKHTTNSYSGSQLQVSGTKPKTNENESYINPLVYVLATVASICCLGIITIIGLKIWKPTYKYTAVPRNRPRNAAESSYL